MALGPRGAAGLCSASRAKRHSGSGPSAQTLGRRCKPRRHPRTSVPQRMPACWRWCASAAERGQQSSRPEYPARYLTSAAASLERTVGTNESFISNRHAQRGPPVRWRSAHGPLFARKERQRLLQGSNALRGPSICARVLRSTAALGLAPLVLFSRRPARLHRSCGLTLRSSADLHRLALRCARCHHAPRSATRWRPLSSNVRPHVCTSSVCRQP